MTVWTHEEVGHNQDAKKEVKSFNSDNVFSTPKPERLIQRVLQLATKPGDIVLDSFLGSGTTAAVAHKMRRQWLGIEMGEHAKTHCVPRLCAVIDGEQGGISEAEKWHGGGGFRFMRLGDEIFTQDGAVNPKSIFPHLPRTCGLPKRTHRFPRKNAKARFWAFITKPATPCCITVF